MVGKPEEFMLANIAETFKLERHQICMVGDRLDTDILFGQDGGLTTMLVLSGTPSTTHLCLSMKQEVMGLLIVNALRRKCSFGQESLLMSVCAYC